MVVNQQLNINSLISAMAIMVIMVAFFRMVTKMLFAEEPKLLPQTEDKPRFGPLLATEPTGTCYQDAWRFLLKEKEGYLIHGSVFSDGKRVGHAWIETETGYIWEPQTGRFYTALGFADIASPIEEHRYTVTEASIMAARTKHFGPWTNAERAAYLGRLPQTKKYLTILDAGDTIFQEGEVVSPDAYERENQRVKKPGLRPAFGKYLADILPPRSPPKFLHLQAEPLMPLTIKRDRRNIGKMVTLKGPPHHPLYGRVGKVIAFRGDDKPGDPWVQVYYDKVGTFPIQGSRLQLVGETLRPQTEKRKLKEFLGLPGEVTQRGRLPEEVPPREKGYIE